MWFEIAQAWRAILTTCGPWFRYLADDVLPIAEFILVVLVLIRFQQRAARFDRIERDLSLLRKSVRQLSDLKDDDHGLG